MERKHITSSYIKSVGYSESKKVLEIELHDGSVLEYKGVPTTIYKELLRSSSPKTYFKENIKDVFIEQKA